MAALFQGKEHVAQHDDSRMRDEGVEISGLAAFF